MRKRIMILMLLGLAVGGVGPAKAQVFQLEQLALDVEKLAQLKAILKDLKEGYQVLDKGYSAIRAISKGSFDLHKAFLDGLLAVSPEVRNDKRAADIVAMEISMVASYKQAWSRYAQDRHFGPEELDMLAQVYGNLMDRSAKALDDLLVVLTDGELRASDAERLRQIDKIYGDLLGANGSLMQVNNSTALLSLQRAADENDAETTKKLYGIE